MKHKQAVKVAIDCMKRRQQQIAVDANLHKRFKVDNPTVRNAAKEYDRIETAKEVLLQERLI